MLWHFPHKLKEIIKSFFLFGFFFNFPSTSLTFSILLQSPSLTASSYSFSWFLQAFVLFYVLLIELFPVHVSYSKTTIHEIAQFSKWCWTEWNNYLTCFRPLLESRITHLENYYLLFFPFLHFHKMCERQVFIKDINPAKTIITTDGKEFGEKMILWLRHWSRNSEI